MCLLLFPFIILIGCALYFVVKKYLPSVCVCDCVFVCVCVCVYRHTEKQTGRYIKVLFHYFQLNSGKKPKYKILSFRFLHHEGKWRINEQTHQFLTYTLGSHNWSNLRAGRFNPELKSGNY